LKLAVVLGNQIGQASLKTLRRWLTESGVEPDSATWIVLTESKDPKEAEIKADVVRVRQELAAIDGLDSILAIGRFGVKLDSDTWRGGIQKCHGHSGTVILDGEPPRRVNAIAMFDPYVYVRYIKDGKSRQAIETENGCKLILSRLRTMNTPVVLPTVLERPRVRVRGLVGLDTETTQDQTLLRRISKTSKVDARASTLKMVGLSDGQLSFEGADFDPDAEPVAYNMPFDAIITGNWDARWHDPKMYAHLLGEKDTEMKSLSLRWLGRPMMHYDEAKNTDREPAYCVADSGSHLDLLREAQRRAPAGITSLYENIERPMMRLFARWSIQGVFDLDRQGAQTMYDRLEDELEAYAATITQLTRGVVENPNSNQQIAKWVFKWDGTGDAPSVAEKVLAEKMHIKGVPEILDYRERAKQKETYLGAWLRWPFELLGCLWKGTGAWTGRPSVSALQLHNVPPELRHFLVPRLGKVLKSYDNSQLEIRIAAHISQDPNMISLLRGEMPGYEDGDIHRWATDLLSKAVGKALSRTFGKIGNFSTLYGGSESAIFLQAAKFGVTKEEVRPVARVIHKVLREMFTGFFSWSRMVERLQRVPGLFGAVLIPPPHPNEEHLKREKVNAPIQRGAVDVVKVQTLALELAGFRTVHQIHDEVIVELDAVDDTPDTDRIIKYVMSNAVRLDVPLKVDSKPWGYKA